MLTVEVRLKGDREYGYKVEALMNREEIHGMNMEKTFDRR